MLGGIYSSEKCAICGSGLKDNGRDRVCCPKHRNQVTNRLRVMLKYKGQWVKKRFKDYPSAHRFLISLQVKIENGTFDARDYRADNPLGFAILADQWLDLKRNQIKRHSWDTLNNVMRKADDAWGNRNIKEIQYGDLEDFLYRTLADLSSKSKANAKSVLNSFFIWLSRRRVIPKHQIPEIPEVPFELSFRRTISKNDQERILDELRSISRVVNPRIWLGCKWLSTYISIRPGELIQIREGEKPAS